MVSKHGDMWNQLSAAVKAGWHQRALMHRTLAKRKIASDLAAALAKKQRIESGLVEVKDGPLTLSKIRFSVGELQRFDEMWDGEDFSVSKVGAITDLWLEPVQPLCREDLAQLSKYARPDKSSSGSPPWSASICRLREHFKRCVLRVKYEGDVLVSYLSFVCALQHPLVCSFLELDLLESPGGARRQQRKSTHGSSGFTFAPIGMAYSYSTDDEYDAKVVVDVLPGVTHLADGQLRGVGEWQALGSFLATLPPLPMQKDQGERRRPLPLASQVDPELVHQHPWLLDAFRSAEGKGRQSKPSSSSAGAGYEPHGDDNEIAVTVAEMHTEASLDLEAMVAELAQKREDEAQDIEPEAPFHWTVRGGKWCAEHHNVPYDSFRATCRNADGKGMLYKYGFNMSFTVTLQKFGDELSRTLVAYWVSKMSYLFSVWDKKGRGDYLFTEEDLQGFVEPPGFTKAFGEAGQAQRQRMNELRCLRPAAPR